MLLWADVLQEGKRFHLKHNTLLMRGDLQYHMKHCKQRPPQDMSNLYVHIVCCSLQNKFPCKKTPLT